MRHLWLWVAALALTAGWAGGAFAQTTAFDPTVEVKVNNDAQESSEKYVYIGKAACDANVPISIKPPQLGKTQQVLEVWVSRTADTKCYVGKERDKTGGADANCIHVEDAKIMDPTLTPTMTTTAQELFDDPKDEDDVCGLQGKVWVYVLAHDGSTETGNDDIASGYWWKVSFSLDTTPPGQPPKISTQGGESQVTISWTLPDDTKDEVESSARVYWDKSGINDKDEACNPGKLVENKEAPAGVDSEDVGYKTRWQPTPGKLGIGPNQQIPVAVAAVDPEGNIGVLSEVKCVKYEEVDGFCDVAKGDDDKGCGDDLETCSAQPWRGASSLSSILAFSLAALLIARRRRATSRGVPGRSSATPLRRNV